MADEGLIYSHRGIKAQAYTAIIISWLWYFVFSQWQKKSKFAKILHDESGTKRTGTDTAEFTAGAHCYGDRAIPC